MAARDASSATALGTRPRIDVRKTYKLYVGGAFPRSESGRSYLVAAADGDAARQRRARLPQGPARRGPRGTRGRSAGWAAKTAMNRGQVLYRVAELMEGRRDQFVAEVAAAEGLRDAQGARGRRPRDRPLGLVRRLGRQDRPGRSAPSNPVAAPYFNFTIPEPTGVVGVVAPETSSLLGLVVAARARRS